MCATEYNCDYVFANAHVVTMDPVLPEADLVAVNNGHIAIIGDRAILQDLQRRGARVIDCAGGTILPGFIDAHCHVSAYAESLIVLDLSPNGGCRSISDIQARIRQFRAGMPEGTWIYGKGYNEFYLEEKRHPNRWELDAVSPNHPVKLSHRSGHAHVLNSQALQEAEIGSGTEDPPGGIIDRELETGEPTGILYGMHRFLSSRIPGIAEADIERGIRLADTKLLSYGVTSVQDASFFNDFKQWKRLESWKRKNVFRPRVTMMMGEEAFAEYDTKKFVTDLEGHHLRLGGIKIMVDRVTGSLRPSRKALNDLVASVHRGGFQIAMHAIEETAADAAADAIENALSRYPRIDARHRIEHCSVCRRSTLEKLAALKTVIVTQPGFLYHEGDRYLTMVPSEELPCLYRIDTMIESGLCVAAGSDAPVGDPNPMVGIGAAVTRCSREGQLLPGSGIERIQAVRMYTSNAAAVNFEENIKGSLRPGMLADFIILDADLFTVPADRIKDIRVKMTVRDGEIVYNIE